MKDPAAYRKLVVDHMSDFQLADKYYFCEGCEFKLKIMQGDKIIKYSCPARFDPYQPLENGRGCPKNDMFMEREKARREHDRGRNR